MKSRIWITPVTNIENFKILDENKVEEREYDSDMDVFTFYNVVLQKHRKSNLMEVSLFDDLIVENDIQYKIIRMLSK